MRGSLKHKAIIMVVIIGLLGITWLMGEAPSKEVVTTPAGMAEKGLDDYMTEPTPEGKPVPVEPQHKNINKEESFMIKLSVSCQTLLNNMNLLDENKHELVPEDGVLFPLKEVVAYEGESVFDVLIREMRNTKMHMEYVDTPMYNSAYIEGINNLYEFDAGELSGWMYKVNEWFPNYGCSRYKVSPGDVVEWVYTCDLGRDVGGKNALDE